MKNVVLLLMFQNGMLINVFSVINVHLFVRMRLLDQSLLNLAEVKNAPEGFKAKVNRHKRL